MNGPRIREPCVGVSASLPKRKYKIDHLDNLIL
jgi:hypothetical protein